MINELLKIIIAVTVFIVIIFNTLYYVLYVHSTIGMKRKILNIWTDCILENHTFLFTLGKFQKIV